VLAVDNVVAVAVVVVCVVVVRSEYDTNNQKFSSNTYHVQYAIIINILLLFFITPKQQ